MTPPDEPEPSPTLVLRRVRNRIIDYLALASSFDAQRAYQQKAPVHVPNEVIEQWADWVTGPHDAALAEPTFSRAEQEAIAAFHHTWEQVVADTPARLPDLEALFTTAPWQRLRSAAGVALAVFAERGRFSEDPEP